MSKVLQGPDARGGYAMVDEARTGAAGTSIFVLPQSSKRVAGKHQISIDTSAAAAGGTASILVLPENGKTYQQLTGADIALSSPEPKVIAGVYAAIKVTWTGFDGDKSLTINVREVP